ncbi:MAG: alpha-ketoglutarate-dependent dioxygenase AlkB [Pseudomonadaceae bacterium]|nr:alpha-ketoglutarate-dependent dioxygenase AlkB [Pseudomonadaceae bacterium]
MEYVHNFLSDIETQVLTCWALNSDDLDWRAETFSIYGRTVTAPRTAAWYGDDGLNYRYSGIDHTTSGWPDQLKGLHQRVNERAGCHFNFVLLNRYEDGGQYMGWHRDDEAAAAPLIASLSLGGCRRFRYRTGPGETSTAIDLDAGSLLIFDGTLQHTLTRTARHVAPRINLTFRSIH